MVHNFSYPIGVNRWVEKDGRPVNSTGLGASPPKEAEAAIPGPEPGFFFFYLNEKTPTGRGFCGVWSPPCAHPSVKEVPRQVWAGALPKFVAKRVRNDKEVGYFLQSICFSEADLRKIDPKRRNSKELTMMGQK